MENTFANGTRTGVYDVTKEKVSNRDWNTRERITDGLLNS